MKLLFVPTWKCNLHCKYCSLRTVVQQDGSYQIVDRRMSGSQKDLPAGDWLSAFKRMPVSHLELTGGEPTMYEGLPELIAGLPSGWTWSITSNTLRTEVLEKLDYSKCVFWTASYHYHSQLVFLKNINYLRLRLSPDCPKSAGQAITLTVTLNSMVSAFSMAHELRGRGYRVNIHRALIPGFSWQDHVSDWDDFVSQLPEGVNVVDTIPPDYKGNRFSSCPAGQDYLALSPEGKVYRCFSHMIWQMPMGTLEAYAPLTQPGPCAIDCTCSYDIDHNNPVR